MPATARHIHVQQSTSPGASKNCCARIVWPKHSGLYAVCHYLIMFLLIAGYVLLPGTRGRLYMVMCNSSVPKYLPHYACTEYSFQHFIPPPPCGMQLPLHALHATRQTPHGSSCLVLAMSTWSVKNLRSPSRHCRYAKARAYGHMTMAVHEMSTPRPPLPG